MTTLWLDDERDPKKFAQFLPRNPGEITWVVNFAGFKAWITENDLPDWVCFDHDLGIGPTGKDCAQFLIEHCQRTNQKLPRYRCHSANPIGKYEILSLLNSYKRTEQ